MKKLPLRNEVSLALDGWTSTNKLAITSVIAYYMDRKLALREFNSLSMRLIACCVPVSKANSG